MTSTKYCHVICGFGPGGEGVLLAAAKSGKLSQMCSEGLCVIDSAKSAGRGQLGKYLVPANTPAGYTIAPINPQSNDKAVNAGAGAADISGPLFDKMRECKAYQDLLAMPPLTKAPLEQIGDYCEQIAGVMLEDVQHADKSSFYSGCCVKELQLMGDGNFKIIAMSDSEKDFTIIAENVCLATGGKCKLPPGEVGKTFNWVAADELQKAEGLASLRQKADDVIAAGESALKVMILGGQHSALSLTWLLLNKLERPVQIEIVHRSPIRVFYENVDAAAEAKYTDFDPKHICSVSGQIHRFGGVRPPMRDLYLNIIGGNESNAKFTRVSEEETQGTPSGEYGRALKENHVHVSAIGFYTNTVPISSADGASVEWAFDPKDGQVLMDDVTGQPHVKLDGSDEAETLPNLFAIGLGYGLKPGGAATMGEPGVRIDGQGQYHTWNGQLVLDGMLAAHKENTQEEVVVMRRLSSTHWGEEMKDGQ